MQTGAAYLKHWAQTTKNRKKHPERGVDTRAFGV